MTALNTQVLERLLDQVLAENPANTRAGEQGVRWAVWAMRAKILEQAAQTAPRQSPVSGRGDPWTSQLGARQIEPSRNTKKAKVLEVLRKAGGRWVDGEQLTAVGGAEGLRRCRELRTDEGWPIERRSHPEGNRRFQYRLTTNSVLTG